MDTQLIVDIFYYAILYGMLGALIMPVTFFFLWSFFDSWKKHILLFYFFFAVLYLKTVAVFYFFRQEWIFFYYPFPYWLQIAGLLIIVLSFAVIKLAEYTLTISVRFFYPLLKAKKFHLKTTGLYKYLRHPIYAVFPWAILGAMFYTGQLVFIPVLLFNLVCRTWYARREEEHLKGFVIGDYEAYKKHTPWRFYPYFGKRITKGRA